jgi:hypothetical protein
MNPYRLTLLILLCTAGRLFAVDGQIKKAQPGVVNSLKFKKDTVRSGKDTTKKVPEKDLYDVVRPIFNHHKTTEVVKKDTVTTKPTYSVVPVAGYSLVSRAVVTLTGNVAFRIDSSARESTITSYISYTENKQFLLPLESEIWTKNNEFDLVGDSRFYKYPQSTFGLGSNSNMKNEEPMDYIYVRFYETALKHIEGNLFLGAGYIIDYHGNITDQGPKNGAPSAYQLYGPETTDIATGYTLNGLYDSRDNSIYPEKGFYASFQFRDNVTWLGSTSSWQSVTIDVRKYFQLPEGSDNILAFWNYDWLILNGKPGYLDLPSNQWDAYSSTGRGYIQGRFRGAREIYGETEYRFKVSANGLFGGVVFCNLQSYSGAPGTKLESIQPGFGPGLRIKLNKVSKTNIAIDYGFGREGSNGLFVNIGEVF